MTAIPTRDMHGQSEATVTCDSCGITTKLRAKHETRRGVASLPGQTFRKLQAMGWSASAAKQTCPTCMAAKRKTEPKEIKPMNANTVPPKPEPAPEPTREQAREIMLILTDVYDTAAQRYKGVETDKTVASFLGVERWGWVSQIREKFFGPDGNEANERMIAEIKDKIRECDALGAQLHDQHDALLKNLRAFNELKAELVKHMDKLTGKAPVKPSPVLR